MNSLLGFHHPMTFLRESRMTSFHPYLRGSMMKDGRDKRSGEGKEGVWQVQDCMTVSSKEEGIWEYKYETLITTSMIIYPLIRSDGRTETCGLYLVTKPDQVVEITVHQVDVDCDSGLVVVMMIIYTLRYLKHLLLAGV